MDEKTITVVTKTKEGSTRREFLKLAGLASGALATSSVWASKAFAEVSSKKYKIAIVPKGLDNPVFALARLGLEERAADSATLSRSSLPVRRPTPRSTSTCLRA